MNMLGKIFTFGIFIASLLLLFLAITVFATHKNWKAEAAGLQSQLTAARNDNQQLESRYRSLESQLQAEVEAARQELAKLETERVTLVGQNANIQREVDQLRLQERENTAAVASTQANNEKLTEELETLRAELRTNQQARDQAFTTAVRSTDQLHQTQGTLTTIRERNAQLVQELANKTALLREEGFDPNAEPGAVVPAVRGVVSATQRRDGMQLIEMTIGSDDGIKRLDTVEVFRGDRYLGRVEILSTEPDRAVGQVLRRFQQGPIQEGDHVATKLRVG